MRRVASRTLSRQRGTLLVVLVVSAVGFWRGTYDVFNTVKATVIALGAVAIVLWSAKRVWTTRRAVIPAGTQMAWVWSAVAVFALGLVAATLSSDTPWRSAFGLPGRHTGLAMYLVYLVLFAATVRLYGEDRPAPIARTLLASAVPVAGYALLQAAGLDPFGWKTVEGGPPVFSTLGNANFLSAYLGIVVPLAVWGAITRTWSAGWRVGSAAVGLAAFAGTIASTSIQGTAVALLGTLVAVAAWLGARRPVALTAIGAGVVGGGAAVALGLGPLAVVRSGFTESLATRLPKWEAALAMIRDRPILGFGLDTFGDWFFMYRSPALAAVSGLDRSVDNPHNVLLHMATGGGLLLAAGWLAFAGATGYALVRGLRRLGGEDRLLLGGLGGAWVAYHGQALVSIDVPPLAVVHVVLAGAIVALGVGPMMRVLALPGSQPVPVTRRAPGRRPADEAEPSPSPANALAGTALALVAVGMAWAVTLPVRADRLAQDALVSAARGDDARAAAGFDRASEVAFWEARYPALEGGWLIRERRSAAALQAQLVAAGREPRGLAHALNVARLYDQIDRDREAGQWYERVLAIDPHTPVVLAEVGRFRLAQGDAAGAGRLLERAVAPGVGEPEWWSALGQARQQAGDEPGAAEAFGQALLLDPQHRGASAALATLVPRN